VSTQEQLLRDIERAHAAGDTARLAQLQASYRTSGAWVERPAQGTVAVRDDRHEAVEPV
jgi:hypothetical protein